MIYQYIHGRTDKGYEDLKVTKRMPYLEDATIRSMIRFDFSTPENCPKNRIPQPVVFINNPSNVKASIIGKTTYLQDLRNTVLNHFYFIDAEDRLALLQSSDRLFHIKTFVSEKEEVKIVDENDPNIYNPELINPDYNEVLEKFNISEEMFLSLLYACLSAATTNKVVYFINKVVDRETVDANLALIYTIYSFLPWQMKEYLGFITYYKSLVGSTDYSTNIKLIFLDNNQENIDGLAVKVRSGDFVFNLQNDYYTKAPQDIKKSALFDFLIHLLRGEQSFQTLSTFYQYVSNNILDYSKLNFYLLDAMFNVYENNYADFETSKTLIANIDNITNQVRSIFQNGINDLASQDISGKDDFLVDVYLRLNIFRDFVITYYATKTTENDEGLKIMLHKSVNKEFTNDLIRKLLQFPEYKQGGLFFIESSMNKIKQSLAAQKSIHEDTLLKYVNVLIQCAEISQDALPEIPLQFIENFFYPALTQIQLHTFDKFTNKWLDLSELIKSIESKKNLYGLYLKMSIYYFQEVVSKANETSFRKITDLYLDFCTIIQVAPPIFQNREFQGNFRDSLIAFISKKDVVLDINSTQYFLTETQNFIESIKGLDFLNDLQREVLNYYISKNISHENLHVTLNDLDDKFLEKINDPSIKTKISEYRTAEKLKSQAMDNEAISDLLATNKPIKPVLNHLKKDTKKQNLTISGIYVGILIVSSLLLMLLNYRTQTRLMESTVIFNIVVTLLALAASWWKNAKLDGDIIPTKRLIYLSAATVGLLIFHITATVTLSRNPNMAFVEFYKGLYKIEFDSIPPELKIESLLIVKEDEKKEIDLSSPINIYDGDSIELQFAYDDDKAAQEELEVLQYINDIPEQLENVEVINISSSDLVYGENIFGIKISDTFDNETIEQITITKIKPTIITFDINSIKQNNEGAQSTNNIQDKTTLTIPENENVEIQIGIECIEPVKVSVKFNDTALIIEDEIYENNMYNGKINFTNEDLGEETEVKLTITAKSPTSKENVFEVTIKKDEA